MFLYIAVPVRGSAQCALQTNMKWRNMVHLIEKPFRFWYISLDNVFINLTKKKMKNLNYLYNTHKKCTKKMAKRQYERGRQPLTDQFWNIANICDGAYTVSWRWSITPYIVWINLWQINQSCHKMGHKCFLIWGDWLLCDPLRGSHDSQSHHNYSYHIRGDRSPLMWLSVFAFFSTPSIPFSLAVLLYYLVAEM